MSDTSCKTCKHWSDPWSVEQFTFTPSDVDEPVRWGTCTRIGLVDRHDHVGGDVLAFTRDASDYIADLHTRDDFGCVLWEPTDG